MDRYSHGTTSVVPCTLPENIMAKEQKAMGMDDALSPMTSLHKLLLFLTTAKPTISSIRLDTNIA